MSLPDPLQPESSRLDGPSAVASSDRSHTAATQYPRSGWRRWAPWVVGAGVLAGAWHWTLAQWLPQWLPGQVWPVLERELGTPVRWRQLDIQPWTFRVSLQGLTVGQPGDPLLTVRSLTVQPSWEVLWRWAPVLRRVTVDGPEVHITRIAPGQFNFSPLIAHWQQRHPPQPDQGGEPARFAVFNISLDGGALHWRDEVLHQQHVIDALHVGVPFVSNLPSFIDAEVEPALSARVDGSPLHIDAEALPFQQGRRSQVHVRWQDIRIPAVMEAVQPFVPQAWRPHATVGTLNTDLTVLFEARTAPQLPRLAITGQVSLDGLGVDWAALPVGGQSLAVQAGWQRLQVRGVEALPLERRVHLGELSLQGVQAQVRPGAAADARPAARRTTAEVARPAQPATHVSAPWHWSVGHVTLQARTLDVQPWASAAGVRALPIVQNLQASVDGLSGEGQAKPANWSLSWQDSAQGHTLAKGRVQVARGEIELALQESVWSVADWTQLAGQVLGAPVRIDQGLLSVQGRATASASAASWEGGQMHLSDLVLRPVSETVADPRGNRVALAGLDVQGVAGRWLLNPSTSADAHQVRVDQVALRGLDGLVVREPGNRWFGIRLPVGAGGDVASAPASSHTATGSLAGSAAPQVVVGQASCRDCRLRLEDRSLQTSRSVMLALGPLQAEVSGLDTARPSEPVRFKVDSRALDSGQVQAQGRLVQAPLSVDAQLHTSRVELRALQPYLDPYVNVVLLGAQPEVDGRLRWTAATARQAQQLRYTGRLGVRELRLQDRVNAADFLSWRVFALDGADLSLDGQQVDAQLGRIQLQDFYGRVIVNPDGRLNLASVMRSERGGATTSVTTPQTATDASTPSTPAAASPAMAAEASASAATAAAWPRPRLAWQRVAVTGGRVDFTDHYIQPNYSARLTQVQGDISAVSSQQAEPATLALSGAVDDAAPLRISGRVQPLGPQLFTDIEGSAKGIELSRLSPYAARYAGYGIDKGTLSVTVHYKVDQGQLEASNRVFLDQFTFGAPSNSPEALKLPIQFAVSLLKNARGEIDINLPVSGSINDPKFSIGGIVWQVFVNLITKAVTAPFALLAGDDGEDWGHVPFDAGSAELNEVGRRRLDGLARSLTDHPDLKVEATGHAEVAADTLALRQAHVERLMQAAKARANGSALADTRVSADESATWLAAAYKAADIPKPRNALGLTKTVPPAEMRSLLMASAPVNDASLRELANARADAVKAYLASRIAPERVLLTASQVEPVGAEAANGAARLPPSRVQLVLR